MQLDGPSVRPAIMRRMPTVSANSVTPVETVALAISVLSLILAGAAFGWQVLSWFLGGGRARATLRHGVLTPSGIVTRAVGRDAATDYAGFRDVGPIVAEILEVRVVNHGRLPLLVESYEVEMRDGGSLSFTPIGEAQGTHPLPHELRPGHRASWWTTMANVDALVNASQVIKRGSQVVGMSVVLADGRKIRTGDKLRRPTPTS